MAVCRLSGVLVVNRFITDTNPIIAAQHQCDKHLRKMIIEEAQMLSTAIRETHPHMVVPELYKSVHQSHPCTLWAGASASNWLWAWKHFNAMCDEYVFRFGKTHATATKLRGVFKDVRNRLDFITSWSNVYHTPHPQCFGDWPYKTSEDWPVLAYRAYLRDYKPTVMKAPMTWTRSKQPHWFKKEDK